MLLIKKKSRTPKTAGAEYATRKEQNKLLSRKEKTSIFIEKAAPYMFSSAFLIAFILFFLFPFFFGIGISFFDWNLFDSSQNEFVGFDNYVTILFNSDSILYDYFWSGLWHTILFVIISVPLLIIVPLFIAILLDQKPPFYRVFRIVLFLPTVFSISAVILVWKWQFYNNGGFINSIITSLGGTEIPFLMEQPWTWITILIVTIWWTMGTNMVIIGAALKNIDKTMYEAASLDGASYPQILLKITLPSLVPQMIIVAITTTIASFNIYGQPSLLPMIPGGPDQSTYVLMMRIRALALGTNSKPGIATAMAICMGIIMILISFVQSKYINKKGE